MGLGPLLLLYQCCQLYGSCPSGERGFSACPKQRIVQKQLKFRDEEGNFYSMLCNCDKISQPSELVFRFTKVHRNTHVLV